MISLKNQRLLVISPHPDDEVLGCGGLIKRIKDEGGKVYVLFITVGDTGEYSAGNGKMFMTRRAERLKEVEAVSKFLKYDNYDFAFPGSEYHLKMDKVSQKSIMEKIENSSNISLNKIKPTIVATPYLHDYNQDHRVTTRAVLAATRPAPNDLKPIQPVVLGFECVPTADWWDNPRNINVYVVLKRNELDAKIKALSLYSSQIRPGCHPRSLQSMKNLAYYRGMQVGERSAEAFFSYRQIL